MTLCIRVVKPANHALVLCIVLCRFALEELHAALAQGEGNFYAFLSKYEFFWGGQKVGNYLGLTQGLIGVFDFRVHRFVYLCANSPPQKSE
jgi:hypothetical protein